MNIVFLFVFIVPFLLHSAELPSTPTETLNMNAVMGALSAVDQESSKKYTPKHLESPRKQRATLASPYGNAREWKGSSLQRKLNAMKNYSHAPSPLSETQHLAKEITLPGVLCSTNETKNDK